MLWLWSGDYGGLWRAEEVQRKGEGVLTRSQQTDMQDGERKLQLPAGHRREIDMWGMQVYPGRWSFSVLKYQQSAVFYMCGSY